MQSSSQIITNNKPTSSFLQAGCPSCHPTNSVKALNGKMSHPMDLLTPNSSGGLPTLSLTTNSSWLPWGRFAMPLISPLMPVPLMFPYMFNKYWRSSKEWMDRRAYGFTKTTSRSACDVDFTDYMKCVFMGSY